MLRHPRFLFILLVLLTVERVVLVIVPVAKVVVTPRVPAVLENVKAAKAVVVDSV